MHALRVLESWLKRNCETMHRRRLSALLKVVEGLVYGGRATLTQLGRSVRNRVHEKHNIKCVDRLLGNEHLWSERRVIYAALAQRVLGTVARPWVLVDWSDVELGHRYVMLKAAVSVGGRALSLYEEVHPLSKYANPAVERAFLKHLAEVLPPGCRPVIVTDAGFRGPWFRVVERRGWDWVGRVRNMVKCSQDGRHRWHDVREWYAQATGRVQDLGWYWLSKKQPYDCRLVLYKARRRAAPGRRRRQLAHETRNARRARDPWLLGTSLRKQQWSAKRVVRVYEQRMHIEETFRDLKNHRWGYGLQHARSSSQRRFETLLLLSTLAMLATWLVGLAAQANGLMRHFQANTIRHRKVLSLFFIGRRILESRHLSVSRQAVQQAARSVPEIIRLQGAIT